MHKMITSPVRNYIDNHSNKKLAKISIRHCYLLNGQEYKTRCLAL